MKNGFYSHSFYRITGRTGYSFTSFGFSRMLIQQLQNPRYLPKRMSAIPLKRSEPNFSTIQQFLSPLKTQAKFSKRNRLNGFVFSAIGISLALILTTDATAQEQKGWKILSLDGGGIRGILTLTILKEIEYRTGKTILELFDFFAGTSTGGIICLGLTKKQPYLTPEIFEKLGISSQESHELLEALQKQNIIDKDGNIKNFNLTLLKLPEKFAQYKEKIISVLKDSGHYRNQPQYSVDNLLDLYKKRGGEIFSPNITRSTGEKIVFYLIRAIEILITPITSLIIKGFSNTPLYGLFPDSLKFGVNITLGVIASPFILFGMFCSAIALIVSINLLGKQVFGKDFGSESSARDDRLAPRIILNMILSFFSKTLLEEKFYKAFISSEERLSNDDIFKLVCELICSGSLTTSFSFFNEDSENIAHQYFFGPKYGHEPLENLLMEYFGDVTLEYTQKPVFVTSYHIEENKPRSFQAFHNKDHKKDEHVKIREAARATSAAPTFFSPAVIDGQHYVDGGMHANDPSLIARVSSERLGKMVHYLLNIGTGHHSPEKDSKQAFTSGTIYEIQNIINTLMNTAGVEKILEDTIPHRTKLQIPLSKEIDLDGVESVEDLDREAKNYIEKGINEGGTTIDEELDDICVKLIGHRALINQRQRKFFWKSSENTSNPVQPITDNKNTPTP